MFAYFQLSRSIDPPTIFLESMVCVSPLGALNTNLNTQLMSSNDRDDTINKLHRLMATDCRTDVRAVLSKTFQKPVLMNRLCLLHSN